MENKLPGRMISTSIADSTDTRVSDFMETSYNNAKLPNEPQSLNCMSAPVRNYAPSQSVTASHCSLLDGAQAAKQHGYSPRSGEFVKCNVPWDDLAPRTSLDSFPGASLTLSSTCKFIKDEKEPAVIMDTACPNFDPTSDLLALDSCCDTDRKLQTCFGDGDAASFAPVSAGPRPALENSPTFPMGLNQPEQLDSRKAVVSFDASAAAHIYKSEVPRWHTQMSPAEPQFWCQSATVADDPLTHSGYSGMPNQGFGQRSPAAFSAFPG